jgi:hypothetical protein
MMEAQDYDAIRARVEERFRQRSAFYTHLAVYTLVSIILWLVWGVTSGMAWQIAQRFPIIGDLYSLLTIPWPLIVMAGWGIGLVAHALNYYVRYGGGAIRREAAIQREIEREMALKASYEKPKNDTHMRLTDDGELEVIEEDPAWPMKRKHE